MEMLRETFFMKGFITAMVIAVLTKVIVWANYHRLLVSSEEMERPKRYWIGTLKKKIENYYNLQTKVNNISCIVDKYFEADKILGINSFFLERLTVNVSPCTRISLFFTLCTFARFMISPLLQRKNGFPSNLFSISLMVQ